MTKNLIIELIALFQGQKLETAIEAVKKATEQVWPKIVTGPLSKLFDSQMETLKIRGCPQGDIDALVRKKSEVITKAMETKTVGGHIPFVPVI